MVRNIREEFYEKHKDKSIEEMLDIIIDDAKKSPLWAKLKRVQPYPTINPSDQSLKIADKND